MAAVGSLWIGDGLGFIQKLCLKSFIHYGHTVYLYVYDMDMDVPDGVIKKSAEDIIPSDQIFTYHGQLAAFSDYFRYRMIKKTGLMWVDADTLCLSKEFFENTPFVFIKESNSLVAGGILKMPASHRMTEQINRIADKLVPEIMSAQEKAKWAELGPLLITKLVKRFGLIKYAQPAAMVNVVDHWSKSEDFWNPVKKDELIEMCDKAYCATFFTGALRMKKFNAEQKPPKGSALEHFAKKFGAI
jgi:hypothetical protein